MHTNRPVLAEAASADNLLASWKRVYAKGARGGYDHVSLEEFAAQLDANLQRLREELIADRYVPEPVEEFTVPKTSNPRERRTLGMLSVRDKVAQDAVRAALERRVDRVFLDCSYGYRPGKGPQRAIARVLHHVRSLKHTWAARADIDDFFGSLDHNLMAERLREQVSDEAVVRLVLLWIKMGAVDRRGRWRDVHSGVTQGGVISPLLANIYLHPFDQALTARGPGLVRYADDFTITARDRSAAERALADATDFLARRLHLRLNDDPRPIASTAEGFAFLGVRVEATGVRLGDDAERKVRDRLRGLARVDGGFPGVLRGINEFVAGWRRYYGSLVPGAALGPIDAIVSAEIARLVRRAFERKQLRNLAEAEGALQNLESLVSRGSDERRRWIERLARGHGDGEGSVGERHARGAGLPVGTALSADAPAHPVATAAPQPPAAVAAARAIHRAPPQRSVEAVVRTRKRRHLRESAAASDLVVETAGSFLGKAGDRVVVRRDRRTVFEAPVFRLSGLTLGTRGVSLSSDVVQLCAEKGLPLLFVAPDAHVVAALVSPDMHGGETVLAQVRALHAAGPALALARSFVRGKLINQASVIKSLHKYRKHADPGLSAAVAEYRGAVRRLLGDLARVRCNGDLAPARALLMSLEGRAAEGYWTLVKRLLGPRVGFRGREHHGARDLVNSLLNYGYAVLHNRVYLALARAALLPQVSFLHALQARNPTLVYDLMEEFRAPVVDRTVIAMLARREPLAVDGAGLLTTPTRRRLLRRVQERLAAIVRFRGKEMKLDEIVGEQAQAIARHVRGEGSYRPFIAKW